MTKRASSQPLRANNLSDFIAHVEAFKASLWEKYRIRVDPWFRGVEKGTTYTLVPGTYRRPKIDEDAYRLEFQLRAFPYLSEVPVKPSSAWDWYFLMQHYGLPTRLLDWTEASLVGLYFALRGRYGDDGVDRVGEDAAVWMLDPFGLNMAFHNYDTIPNATDRQVQAYLCAEPYHPVSLPAKPIAIQPPFHSRRILAQKGMFTVHGRMQTGLEQYRRLGPHLRKVVIPSKVSWRILDALQTAGIWETTLFPELSSVSRDLIGLYADAPQAELDSEAPVQRRRLRSRAKATRSKRRTPH